MAKEISEEVLVNIKTASFKTGISEFVLRAWEQRYNAVTPRRSNTNRRLYSEENLEKLNLLRNLVDNGYSIGSVAGLPGEKLKELCRVCSQKGAPSVKCTAAECEQLIKELYRAAENLDREVFITILKSSFNTCDTHTVIKNVLIPYLTLVGSKWEQGELDIYTEHFSTGLIKSVLMELISAEGGNSGRETIAFAAPEGQHHTLSLILGALVSARSGINSIYMGGNLPVEELMKVISDERIDSLVLALIYPADDIALKSSIERLVSFMPVSKKIIFIGDAAENYWSEKFRGKVILSRDYDSYTGSLSLC